MDQVVTDVAGGKSAQTTADRPHRNLDAPGVSWRRIKTGWEARWRARHDLIKRGYHPKSLTVWSGAEVDAEAIEQIERRCQTAQAEMLIWNRRGGTFDEPEPAARERRRGYVYFISDGEAIKIGFANDPVERLGDLQTATARLLTLLATAAGRERDESTLHARFAHLRIRGEWFQIVPELTAYIEEIGRCSSM